MVCLSCRQKPSTIRRLRYRQVLGSRLSTHICRFTSAKSSPVRNALYVCPQIQSSTTPKAPRCYSAGGVIKRRSVNRRRTGLISRSVRHAMRRCSVGTPASPNTSTTTRVYCLTVSTRLSNTVTKSNSSHPGAYILARGKPFLRYQRTRASVPRKTRRSRSRR